jgi:hypothetical protein
MQEIKQGYKTTEFWISFLTSLFGVCILLGLVTPAEGEILGAIERAIGGLMTIGSSVAYTLSRGKTKGSIEPKVTQLIEALSKVVKAEKS